MKKIRILTPVQESFLALLGKQKFSKSFYLTGGTALAAFYIPYRLSEDLDFFSENEIHTEEIIVFLRSIFPFKQIEKPMKEFGIMIDSARDIAVNKLFTIYQKPRSRDFMDLYMLCRKYHFSISGLIRNAKVKFDWHVDPLKLGSQFLFAKKLKDYPKLSTKLEEPVWQKFFEVEAKNLKSKILKN